MFSFELFFLDMFALNVWVFLLFPHGSKDDVFSVEKIGFCSLCVCPFEVCIFYLKCVGSFVSYSFIHVS